RQPSNRIKLVSIVCATFVLVCAVKRNIFAIMVLKIFTFDCSHVTSLSPPSTFKSRQNGLYCLCYVCAGLCCQKKYFCYYGFKDIPVLFFTRDRKSTRLNSSHTCISYAVF